MLPCTVLMYCPLYRWPRMLDDYVKEERSRMREDSPLSHALRLVDWRLFAAAVWALGFAAAAALLGIFQPSRVRTRPTHYV